MEGEFFRLGKGEEEVIDLNEALIISYPTSMSGIIVSNREN